MNDTKILELIPEKPISFIKLAQLCNIRPNQNSEFSKILFKLVKENKISKTRNSEYFKMNFINSGSGKFLANPRGFGFVDLNNSARSRKSVFFSPMTRGEAIDGDMVEYKVFIDPINKKEIGLVTKIISRNPNIVGLIKRDGKYLDLHPLNQNLGNRIRVTNKELLKEGHLVAAQIISVNYKFMLVKITKDLGHKNDKFSDIKSLIIASGVNYVFPESVIEEANKISETITEEDLKGREDLKDLYTITIDGRDSKDFDDAISVEKNDDGYTLYVHIADVSHYVKTDSVLNKEALKRGTSIYLPSEVIPMLPEKLSNNVCSLMPNVDRLTITCKMKINESGDVTDTSIFPSVINSNNRSVYEEVNKFLKDADEVNIDEKLADLYTQASALSKILMAKSEANGYIDFKIEEAKIILDEKGKTSSIQIIKQGAAEKIIESFMVLANEHVAQTIQDKKLPFIYRIHDKPSLDNIKSLKNVLKMLKIDIKLPDNPNSKDFANGIKQIKEEQFDNFVKSVLLRTMSKAVYKNINIGHFGLALKAYTHFTSPIRRYPDLMVHRMLREYLFDNGNGVDEDKFKDSLKQIALDNSNSETAAISLERTINDFKKAEFYGKFVGQKRKGQISSINKYGMFIEFPDKVTGLVRADSIKTFTKISDDKLKLISRDRTYSLGDTVEVKINSVDKFNGKVSLVI